ncbi:hypothetical protein EVAR_91482_1 [Eumeta japonica]|uniref:Uncharacterized protein n=1 Tax=Eumeta variegata TaxID=151549 RepID=A0A4C1VAR8_EUMVA|nr:hypothetical protein EVAR_91482_1 [Eumeta japonica]
MASNNSAIAELVLLIEKNTHAHAHTDTYTLPRTRAHTHTCMCVRACVRACVSVCVCIQRSSSTSMLYIPQARTGAHAMLMLREGATGRTTRNKRERATGTFTHWMKCNSGNCSRLYSKCGISAIELVHGSAVVKLTTAWL